MPATSRTRALSAAIFLFARAQPGRRVQTASSVEYVFKPLTTLLVAALAFTGRDGADPRYRGLVFIGLVCSLAGDVFLMLPGDWFVPGLASFLVAHVFYIAAFTRGGWRSSAGPAALCGIYLIVLMYWLLPEAGEVRLPVAVYGTVICAMAWQALERAKALGTTSARLAAAGAILFVISDTSLAINRFLWPFWLSPLAVMGTYVPAQWLIALSVVGSGAAGTGRAD